MRPRAARQESGHAAANAACMPRVARRSRLRALRRPAILRRWAAVLVLMFVAFLYYRPLRTYLETRDTLARRTSEVQALASRQQALERRLASERSVSALVREARRLGFVKPGERLFIVKGIPAWRRAHSSGASR